MTGDGRDEGLSMAGCGDEVIDLHYDCPESRRRLATATVHGKPGLNGKFRHPTGRKWALIFRFGKTKLTSNGLLKEKKRASSSDEMSCSFAAF